LPDNYNRTLTLLNHRSGGCSHENVPHHVVTVGSHNHRAGILLVDDFQQSVGNGRLVGDGYSFRIQPGSARETGSLVCRPSGAGG
jgi:hypothetical protein